MTELFRTILHMSLLGGFACLLVLPARFLLRNRPKLFSYALWAVVFFRFLCPISFSSAISLLPVAKQEVITEVGNTLPNFEALYQGTSNIVIATPPVTKLPTNTANTSFLHLATVVWLLGLLFLFFFACVRYLRLKQQLFNSLPEEKGIVCCDGLESPFVFGLPPIIYLPKSLSTQEKTYILAHERVHIRRGDFLLKPLAYGCVLLHWFNPLAWLAFRLMSKDMEMSCDEAALKVLGSDHKKAYSMTLLALSARSSGLPYPVGFGENNVKGRIQNLLTPKKAGLMALVICLIIGFFALANPKQAEAPPAPTEVAELDAAALLDAKHPYIGDASANGKVIGLLTWPEAVTLNGTELQTTTEPYNLTIDLLTDTDMTKFLEGGFGGNSIYYRNALLLMALIDNCGSVTFRFNEQEALTFTRTQVTANLGYDPGEKTKSLDAFTDFVALAEGAQDYSQMIAWLEELCAPTPLSSPDAIIRERWEPYENILKQGSAAEAYLLSQFQAGVADDLRAQIMARALYELLGVRCTADPANYASPSAWFADMTIRKEISLQKGFSYEGDSPISAAVYNYLSMQELLSSTYRGLMIPGFLQLSVLETKEETKVFAYISRNHFQIYEGNFSDEVLVEQTYNELRPAVFTLKQGKHGYEVIEMTLARDGGEFLPSLEEMCVDFEGKPLPEILITMQDSETGADACRKILQNNMRQVLSNNGITKFAGGYEF